MVFFAVCSGGGALARPSNGAATYADMLKEVPGSARYVVPIICGNDYYGSRQPLPHDVVTAARALCAGLSARGVTSYAVVGMSSRVWGYDQKMSGEAASQFDINSESLFHVFSEEGLPCTRGVGELLGVETADSIGHVHPNSRGQVCDAIEVWFRACVGQVLPVPAPPPPPPPTVPPAMSRQRRPPRSPAPAAPPVEIVTDVWPHWSVALADAGRRALRIVPGYADPCCYVCSLKAKRWRPVGAWHFETEAHNQGIRSVEHKLWNCEQRPDWLDVGAEAYSVVECAVESPPSSPSPVPVPPSPICADVEECVVEAPAEVLPVCAAGVSQRVRAYELPAAGRHSSGAWVYYPDGYDSAADPRVAGAWLVDSFSQFWKSEREWDYYMGRMLRSVWDSTGVVCMAVCAGGSALLRPSGGGLTYAGLAAVLPGGLDWVAPIVCGNDLYKHGAIVQAVDDALLAAVDDFCACARGKAANVFGVVGVSASAWQYDRDRGLRHVVLLQ